MNGELTGREREVWALFQDHTQAYIADKLGISRRTVEIHCARARQKLGIVRKTGREPSKTYVITADCGMLKIGLSTRPRNRLRTLQIAMPFELSLEHVIDRNCESRMQRDCREFHVRGEWFRDCPEIREVIARYL